jgi:hypothetical protein
MIGQIRLLGANGFALARPPSAPSGLRRGSPSFSKEVDASNNFLWFVRLFERTIVTKVFRLVGRSGGSGSQDNVNARVMLANPTGETETVHLAAQPYLREDDVDCLSGTQHCHDVGGRDALENPISALAQIAGDDHPDQDVGLHDQYSARCRAVGALVI